MQVCSVIQAELTVDKQSTLNHSNAETLGQVVKSCQ